MDSIDILIKYGELTLKGENVASFKQALAKNISAALVNYQFKIRVSFSRIYLTINKSDYKVVCDILKNIYGIHSFAAYISCENDIEIIKKVAFESVKDLEYKTFKVETKRKNKKFLINSLEVSRVVGGYINHHSKMNVDVFSPELLVRIEIRNKETLIYYDEVFGSGGLPVGTSGNGLLMLSGGIDSPVAGFLINKRGVKFDAIHFTSPPYTAKESVDKVMDLCNVLKDYNGEFNLYLVKFTKVQESLLQLKKNSYFITIMRRIMYRIASIIANDYNYKIIINGDCIGQVASQTLDSMNVVDNVASFPVIRPLAVYDKLEVIRIAKSIKTYDISIRNFEDCCTVFVPKSPVTKPRIQQCERLEYQLELDELIEECVNNIEIVKINSKNEFQTLL